MSTPFIDVSDRWASYYMSMAFLTAMQSKDISTQVGAVIVGPDKEIRATGFNGPPRGFPDDHADLKTDKKNQYVVHAETNAVLNASRAGVSVKGCDLYVTLRPCSGCALLLSNAGISRLIFHAGAQNFYLGLSNGTWSWDLTDEIMKSGGVHTWAYLGGLHVPIPIRIRGKEYLQEEKTPL